MITLINFAVRSFFVSPPKQFYWDGFLYIKLTCFDIKNALRTFYMTTRVDISLTNFFHNFCFQKKEWSFQPCLARPFLSPPKQNINKQKLYCKYAKKLFESFFYISSVFISNFESQISYNTLESDLNDEKLDVPSETLMSPPKRPNKN